MDFAGWSFRVAGIWGILVLAPLYFMESKLGTDFPPAITHPEFFYGFIGVALAWQVAFLAIAKDPVRLRPLMIAAILEKFSYGGAILWLFAQGRVPPLSLTSGLMDLAFGVCFAVSYRLTGAEISAAKSP